MYRRDFIKTSLLAGAAASGVASAAVAARSFRLRDQTRPVAIAMWDFSWLLRHHPAGEFCDWDRVLDELCERGYNAVRIDLFPHLVAARPDGSICEEYYFPKADWKPAMWGNKFSIHARPREGVISFLQKCRKRSVHVGFSTWFFGPDVDKIEELNGFVRVWEETLAWVEAHGLLDVCLYVDLLNEYPLFHGFSWFTKKLESLKGQEAASEAATKRQAHEWAQKPGMYNQAQWEYYRWFGNEAIRRLKKRWPGLDFLLSQTRIPDVPWEAMDFTEYNALDVHCWMIMNDKLGAGSGYWENIHGLADNDLKFADISAKLGENWKNNRAELTAWLDAEMGRVAARSKELGVPCGNTEGWGIINWLDHPALGWDIIKESAEIAAALGHKHGYMFNCASNFTHPQFPGYWDDVRWHRCVTKIIRGRL
jgi:hypothetical protein